MSDASNTTTRQATIQVSIVGGSGYSGGELLRLLSFHPHVSVQQVTSERLQGRFAHSVHPNLRGVTRLKFVSIDDLQACDVLFLCLPHGSAVQRIEAMQSLAPKIIDLSADFRLQDPALYETWYHKPHPRPELLNQFVYGIPEINRAAISKASHVSAAGCNATATILALRPFISRGLVDHVVVEVKAGSSEGGNASSDASHHPERSGAVRSYKPTGHRHVAEMVQVLGTDVPIHFSATSIEMVRGILATCHLFLTEDLNEKDVWKLLRADYGDEPFVRIVKERSGIYRYPEPKILAGSNYCDIGFERDPHAQRLVVVSAIDNLMKGSAGQALQNFNLMHGFNEATGLGFPGLHPI
ncbi:MAG: N-acetyl-gamma-glutamyl-phosphate/LysW-gamma-L-alpha-aminoadipyl-6-phosphate reductase [Gammaproteobacteria bacterium]|jgi:N-acetyl-gamma-glutamyl-phosphate/LysW-gamma-L-alpha-aminoadipyl-6-phosphate reductase